MIDVCFLLINVYWKGVPLNGFRVVILYRKLGRRSPLWHLEYEGSSREGRRLDIDDSGMGTL